MRVHVLTVEKGKEEQIVNQARKNSTYVILKDVEKCMGKHLISEHIFVGTLEKDLLYATGSSAARGLPEVMSYRGTEEPIQGRRGLSVQNVPKGS